VLDDVAFLQGDSMMLRISSMTLVTLLATNAYADDPAPTSGAPAEPAAPVAAPTPAPAPTESVAGTLRNGFSASVGEEFGTSAAGASVSGQLYGIDWRIGARITTPISVYLHSHLSLGTASVGGASGATGNFATAVVGEYTLPMRLFFGGGVGYGVLNNPSGPLVELRAGYYPFENSSTGKARRLNVALDARWYFVSDGGTGVTITHIALSLGYDRF
jgi:hypothetical protein